MKLGWMCLLLAGCGGSASSASDAGGAGLDGPGRTTPHDGGGHDATPHPDAQTHPDGGGQALPDSGGDVSLHGGDGGNDGHVDGGAPDAGGVADGSSTDGSGRDGSAGSDGGGAVDAAPPTDTGVASGPVTAWAQSPDHCAGKFIQGSFSGVWFASTSDGFAVGNAGIFRTTNGGATWTCTSTNNQMDAVWGFGSNAWAVGSNGFFGAESGYATWMAWNGQSWSAPTTTTETINGMSSVWTPDGQIILGASTDGAIFSIQGTTLVPYANGTTGEFASYLGGINGIDLGHYLAVGATGDESNQPFYGDYTGSWGGGGGTVGASIPVAVSPIDASNAWAVGGGGLIEKLTSASWTPQTSGTTNNLYGVYAKDAEHVWAVGENGFIDSWNGSAWVAATSPTSDTLYGVQGVDTSHVWAVGQDGTIVGWNGSTWGFQTRGNDVQVMSMAFADANHGFAGIARADRWLTFDGSAWGNVAAPFGVAGSGQLTGLAVVSDTLLWGAFYGGASPSSIWKWSAGTWTQSYTLASGPNPLGAIWAADATHVWSVDSQGNAYVLNGSTWSVQPTGVSGTYGVSGVDASHVWVVGQGGVAMWNGSAWLGQNATGSFVAVYALDTTHVWAVGYGGAISFYDGTTWSAQTSPTTNELQAVWAADATHAWASGQEGTIVGFNGTAWASEASGTSELLTAISGTSASNVYIGGGNGLILKGIP